MTKVWKTGCTAVVHSGSLGKANMTGLGLTGKDGYNVHFINIYMA